MSYWTKIYNKPVQIWAADTETSDIPDEWHERGLIANISVRISLIGADRVTGRFNAAKDRTPEFSTALEFFDYLASINFNKGSNDPFLIYFHNLSFDGAFIICEMWDHVLTTDGQKFKIIRPSNSGNLYEVKFVYRGVPFVLRDSLALYNQKLEIIGENLSDSVRDQKGLKHDYHKLVGQLDYNLIKAGADDYTPEEKQYFWRDVEILRVLLWRHLKENVGRKRTLRTVKLSASSLAESYLKQTMDSKTKQIVFGKKDRGLFENMEDYKFIRRSYLGGFSHVEKREKGRLLGNGFVIDKNSMYPSQMLARKWPDVSSLTYISTDEFWIKMFGNDKGAENLLIAEIGWKSFQLIDGQFPTLPRNLSTHGQDIESDKDLENDNLVLTNFDLYWFFRNYSIDGFKLISCMAFDRYVYDPFKIYIDYWGRKKEHARDDFERMNAKNYLNRVYGKFGQTPFIRTTDVLKNSFGYLEYYKDPESASKSEEELFFDKDGQSRAKNIAIATFVTARARDDLFKTIVKIKKSKKMRYLYSDTDSLHVQIIDDVLLNSLAGLDFDGRKKLYIKLLDGCDIPFDDVKIGKWKIESDFKHAKFLRSKVYTEQNYDNSFNIKIAGITTVGRDHLKMLITNYGFDRFTFKHGGLILPSKQQLPVKGGVKIVEMPKILHESARQWRDLYE